MRNIYSFLAFGLLSMPIMAVAQRSTQATPQPVWNPNVSETIYRNPVIYADYSDPDVCRVGHNYYLTASSFNQVPGLPILHSRDLVNWSIVGHALDQVPPARYYASSPRHGKGVWAPSIRHHNGWFYIFWGDPDHGVYMVRSKQADKGWSRPTLVMKAKGVIDPCPFWDEDGTCYLAYAWAASRAGVNSVICMAPMNAQATRVTGPGSIVFDGNDDLNHTAEGPKVYKRNGFYYLMFPAGGVKNGWQMCARSKHIMGPYEARRVMQQGATVVNGPHQGAWVDTPMGEHWFMHFQDVGVCGRVTHLQPMKWVNDWPVIGIDTDGDGCGEPVNEWTKPIIAAGDAASRIEQQPAEGDECNSVQMSAAWQWSANAHPLWGMTTPYGYMRLYSWPRGGKKANLWHQPNLLLQKFPAPQFSATTHVSFSAKENKQEAGLVVMGWDYSALTVRRMDNAFQLCQLTCRDAEQEGKEQRKVLLQLPTSYSDTIPYAPTIKCKIYLRVNVKLGGICQFAYSLDGIDYTPVGSDFQAREGKWIGAKVGLVTLQDVGDEKQNRGWMDVDWFRITPLVKTVDDDLAYCHRQVLRAVDSLAQGGLIDFTRQPRNILQADMQQGRGAWNTRPSTPEEWCSGFWPGILWLDYEYSGDKRIKKLAQGFSSSLNYLAHRNPYDHDLGFLMFCSYGNAMRVAPSKPYRDLIVQSAHQLARLYNPRVGTMLSWPREVKKQGWPHNTIMDNMMNLEMLFWAAKHGGHDSLYTIAKTHAVTTMNNHFRPDGSCYHVAVYDTIGGQLIKGVTHQGYADNSMWARGQSWAIYGYTMVYRETRDRQFLDFAQKVTDIYLKRLQERAADGIPLWDFDDPDPHAPRDASAACVVASALLELAQYVDQVKAQYYLSEARRMLASLSSGYQSGMKNVAFLLHSTGHKPAGSEIDASIIYADYYYLEALLRLRRLNEGKDVLGVG